MKTGWQQIHVMDTDSDDGEDDYWFYFKNNGQKTYLASDSKDAVKIATVNGKKYGFDENGKMVSGWTAVGTPPTTPTASNYAYFSDAESGARISNGWFKVVPSDKFDQDNNNDENDKWYYGESDGTLVTSQLKKIKGKWYAFNEKGAMISGLQAMEVDGENKIVSGNKGVNSDNIDTITKGELTGYGDYGIYYFGSGDDGAMRTGTQKVDVDGDSYTFNFDTKAENRGKGVNGLVKDVFYQNGKRLTADSDDKYTVVEWDAEDPDSVPTIVKRSDVKAAANNGKINNPNWYLIKTSGNIVKASNSSKDGYDYYYTVTKNDTTGQYNVTYYGANKEK